MFLLRKAGRLVSLKSSAALVLGLATLPAFAGEYNLVIARTPINITGRPTTAITINGQLPAPTLHWREGEKVVIHVTNRLKESTSLHWHGLLLPADMDGVPGISFPGIAPGTTFTYRFTVKQSGTYWYHSHSGGQEQEGLYGALIIQPRQPEPFHYDRDYVVVLSDWSDTPAEQIFALLKKRSNYYNFHQRTLGTFFHDVAAKGLGPTVRNRLLWGRMRMDPTDISDVTGYTYTYLINGRSPKVDWTARFKPGERVRLRFINAAAMTYFDVRIPGLKMTLVQADGQNVRPVKIDEFRIAVAETYDVIVTPRADRAYTIFAEGLDRSGYARATLSPRPGLSAPVPPMDPRFVLTMRDMGMGGMNQSAKSRVMQPAMNPGQTLQLGPSVTRIAKAPTNRLHDPGDGLRNNGRRVLTYADLESRVPVPDNRRPDRTLVLHLTGNMERYMWQFDGKKYTDSVPIKLRVGERVRFVLINDTMMNHPIHLHGMFSQLENGHGDRNPLKHTVNVQPGERLSFVVTADAPGGWALHCHLLYHFEYDGMFRQVVVSPLKGKIVANTLAPTIYSTAAAVDTVPPPPGARLTVHDNARFSYLLFDQLEYRKSARSGEPNALRWDLLGWYGGDIQKLWFKSEGERSQPGGLEQAEVQLLYGRAIASFWDFQAGIRHAFRPESPREGVSSRSYVVLGVQGLAPYWFDVSAAAFLSDRGRLSARLSAEYELLLTQRWVLQPRLETTFSVQDNPQLGLGRGFNSLGLGLRLRYEIRREFAPYLGLTWRRWTGATAGYARAAGTPVSSLSYVVGLRFWF